MRLTLLQAEELIEVYLYGMGEQDNAATYSATVFDADVSEVNLAIDDFVGALGDFDRDSITVTPDKIEDMDVPCVSVTIKLEASCAPTSQRAART